MLRLTLLAGLLLVVAGCGNGEQPASPGGAEAPADSQRVVALGGSVAETVYALGAGSSLVARDISATVPAAVHRVPSVGYFRQLGAEGVLSVTPTLVLADPDAGPPEALAQVEAAGVRVVHLPGGPSAEEAFAQIRAIAAALGREEAGVAVVDSMGARLDAVGRRLVAVADRPRVLFVLGQGGGALQISGTGTHADAFIRLAGGENALTGVEGYTAITPEAVAAAAPDVVLVLSRTVQTLGGTEALIGRADLGLTPAAQNSRVVVMPDAALNFGPSLGWFVAQFAGALHPVETPAP
ncbi:MAG TPA: ABC transporter substrate-binding protein [Rhodothermales bacterium]|nr:ABC transporter substrate-binding protein [Rhodothermales bacterium]